MEADEFSFSPSPLCPTFERNQSDGKQSRRRKRKIKLVFSTYGNEQQRTRRDIRKKKTLNELRTIFVHFFGTSTTFHTVERVGIQKNLACCARE